MISIFASYEWSNFFSTLYSDSATLTLTYLNSKGFSAVINKPFPFTDFLILNPSFANLDPNYIKNFLFPKLYFRNGSNIQSKSS